MYQLVKLKGLVRIPPNKFNEPLEKAAKDILREEYEGALDHNAEYEVLTFVPQLQEVVEGEVVEVTDFGIFVRLGPTDGFVHLSQIYDDYFSYDRRQGVLLGRDTHYELRTKDIVRARIVTISVSTSGGARSIRIGMTMRQPFLGKLEWIKKEVERAHKAKPRETKKVRG